MVQMRQLLQRVATTDHPRLSHRRHRPRSRPLMHRHPVATDTPRLHLVVEVTRIIRIITEKVVVVPVAALAVCQTRMRSVQIQNRPSAGVK